MANVSFFQKFILSISVLGFTSSKLSSTFLSSPVLYEKYSSCTINQCKRMISLSEWSFTKPNLLIQFAIDPIKENYVRRVRGCVFSYATPTPLKAQLQLVSASHDVLKNILELDPIEEENPMFAKFIAGNQLLPGSETLAHRYGGYQFGYWADQLGDGRAISIGEYVNR
jgi:hypothetical protein